ncbi:MULTISPECIES: hypothetical protein [Cysteiniphilum]|uniref:hypothetical protein n=1 Tax=Cysteiniphilum TaxID=2056696 RepID=UPI00177E0B36|nr:MULTISPECIES: hypothetical protein [Cysteiniphilum]
MSNFDFDDKPESKGHGENPPGQPLSDQEELLIQEGKKRLAFKFEKIYLAYVVIAIAFMIGAYIILSTLFFNDNKRNEQKTAIRQHQTLNADFVEVKPKTAGNSFDREKVNHLMAGESINLNKLSDNTKLMTDKVDDFQQKMTKELQSYEQRSIDLAKHIKVIEAKQNEVLKLVSGFESILIKLSKDKKSDELFPLIHSLEQQLQYMNAKEHNLAEKLQLTAVVDGIAWFEDKQGHSLSVKQGQTLDGYGKIIKIDASSAQVYTSSGFVFK